MIEGSALEQLSEEYLTALRVHSETGGPPESQAAKGLGVRAVALGLETLDLVKIHDRALETLVWANCPETTREEIKRKASIFFAIALVPIEKTHSPAREARDEYNRLNTALVQRTEEVEVSHRKLEEGITRRKTTEAALRSSGSQTTKLLEESRHLQEHLQEMVHLILAAQEDERKSMSLNLQDEIAQTLLGIQVRLAALKAEVTVSSEDIKKEIATTRRLVQKSVRSINIFARELGTSHAD